MNPRDLSYQMPPEWAEHSRTIVSWPVQASMVYPDEYEETCGAYADMVRAIAEFEPVTVLVNPEDMDAVSGLFGGNGRIECLAVEHNDSWVRDNGPTFITSVEDGSLAGVNWKFNAWGGKYAPWDLDDAVAVKVLEHYGVKRFDAPLVMEGGSFHVDGEGTLITTEECLLNPNRNPELSREEIEAYLQKYLNVNKVIWLRRGLDGDETDGHVDNIACFAAPGKVILQVCGDPEDANYAITQENLKILREAVDAKGRQLEVIPIAQPPYREHNGHRLTLSYINFYFVNGGIILPVFGADAEETDRLAEEKLREVFPERAVRRVDGMGIIREGGNVHCATQQIPKGFME